MLLRLASSFLCWSPWEMHPISSGIWTLDLYLVVLLGGGVRGCGLAGGNTSLRSGFEGIQLCTTSRSLALFLSAFCSFHHACLLPCPPATTGSSVPETVNPNKTLPPASYLGLGILSSQQKRDWYNPHDLYFTCSSKLCSENNEGFFFYKYPNVLELRFIIIWQTS